MHLTFHLWYLDDVLKWIWQTGLYQERDDFLRWTEWSNRLSTTSAFLFWLAGNVADDLMAHRGTATTDQLVNSVDDDITRLQRDAELYLQKTYFPYLRCANQRRMTVIFRHLVQRRIRWQSSIQK